MNKAFAIAVCAAVAATCAHAQPYPKRNAGLWEATSSIGQHGMPGAEAELGKLSPEERAQASAALSKLGMGLGATPGTLTMRFCLTREDAADENRMLARFQKNNSADCTPQDVKRSAAGIQWHSVCKAKDGTVTENSSGMYNITPVSYAAEWTGKSSEGTQMHMQQTARWVGSDCGTVK